MKIVTVIPLAKGLFKEDLTYFTAKNIPDGSIVTIPVRNKQILGIAVSSEYVSETKSDIKNMSFNLRKILEVKEHSIFSDEFLKAGIELSQYFAAPKGLTLVTIIPSAFREEYDKIAKFNRSEARPSMLGLASLPKNIRPEKLLFQVPIEDRLLFYKTLIRGSFAEKKSVFMVLPSERDIQIFKDTLGHGIEKFTFAIHGGLSAKKQIEQFKNITSQEHSVLIFGTAQFLSIPRQDIGTIILEHESASGYKNFTKPHLDMRIFTEIFAQKISAKLILADNLLSFESIARKEIDGFSEVHPLSFKINFEGEIEIAGKQEKFKVLEDDSISEIQQTIKKKENVFIFSLRKGLATMTICGDCSEPLMCENCSAPIVLYLSRDGQKRMFICNRCGKDKTPDTRCPRCESWNLLPLGIGTDTVFEEVKKKIREARIFKLDKESAKTAKGAEKIAKEFEESPGSILVGTEMAFSYLKNKVLLSIIASFDSLWSIPNFRMSEKIVRLIISIISKTKDKLVIQTKNEKDSAIMAIRNENLLSFVREELEDRKKLGYPPFKRFIKITHLGDKQQMLSVKKELAENFKEYDPEIFSGFVSKLKNQYATNALIKMDTKKWSLPELSLGSSIEPNLLSKLSSLPPEFSVNIDPEDLL